MNLTRHSEKEFRDKIQSGDQTVTGVTGLKINGAVATALLLTIADLKKMPRKTLTMVNLHDKETEVFEGVALEELLSRSGVVARGKSPRTGDGDAALWCQRTVTRSTR